MYIPMSEEYAHELAIELSKINFAQQAGIAAIESFLLAPSLAKTRRMLGMLGIGREWMSQFLYEVQWLKGRYAAEPVRGHIAYDSVAQAEEIVFGHVTVKDYNTEGYRYTYILNLFRRKMDMFCDLLKEMEVEYKCTMGYYYTQNMRSNTRMELHKLGQAVDLQLLNMTGRQFKDAFKEKFPALAEAPPTKLDLLIRHASLHAGYRPTLSTMRIRYYNVASPTTHSCASTYLGSK